MYAVIFRAEILELDDEYSTMAKRMRDLARNGIDHTLCKLLR